MVDYDPIEDSEMKYFEGLQPAVQADAMPAKALKAEVHTMKLGPAVSIETTATVADAIRAMQQHGFGSVLVAEEGRIAGIFTERDVLKKVALQSLDPESTPIHEVMTPNPESVRRTDPIKYALHLMAVGGYRHVPVTDDAGHPLHVISVRDVTNYMADFFPQEIVNLPPSTENYADRRHGG